MLKKMFLLLTVLLLCTAAYAETTLTDLYQQFLADGWRMDFTSSWGSTCAACITKDYTLRIALLTQDENGWKVTADNPSYDSIVPYRQHCNVHFDTEDLLIVGIFSQDEGDPSIQRYYRLTDGRWLLESVWSWETWHTGVNDETIYTQEYVANISGDQLLRSVTTLDEEGNPLKTMNLPPLPNVLTDDERDLMLEGKESIHSLTAYGYAVDECGDVEEALLHRLYNRLSPALPYRYVRGVMNQNDAMYYLLEDEQTGSKYMLYLTYDSQNNHWQSALSAAMPPNTGIGLENFTDTVRIGDTAYGIRYTYDGRWTLYYLIGQQGDCSLYPFGVMPEYFFYSNYLYGDAPWTNADLLTMDWTKLPHSSTEALRQLDTARWATPNNPNPDDRLHLRDKPDRSGVSLGKYYNGIPVRVLDMGGEWTKVRIGGKTGYMMTKYLAFGERVSRVEPMLSPWLARNILTAIEWDDGSSEMLTPDQVNNLHVVGMDGNIMLMWNALDNRFGRIAADQLWPGNG